MMAPDKIYIHEASAPEMTDKLPYHIEYIRKDALIEELVEFLDRNYLIKTKCPMRWVPARKIVEDFKNYIK